MVLEHTGTCNDGVGKPRWSDCGDAPASENQAMSNNVLIGNFALFGATGGRVFIEGKGDRFAVRNSGSTAVVEGVGDFCCEYMTNGAVLNLGGFSKGFAMVCPAVLLTNMILKVSLLTVGHDSVYWFIVRKL